MNWISQLPLSRAARPWARTSPYGLRKNSLRSCFYSSKSETDDPLRILFCGTDYFSTLSLKALHEYSKTSEGNVRSIDVVTRTDKRVGRGRKTIKSPAVKVAATELGLPLHQIDTFTGWQPPTFDDGTCNLVIAVSFGLLVPPRILGSAKYGGLNVHPSMLPDLRGPAPIAWTIILGRRTTGISLQTLHPSRFDEGQILDQTPKPGLEIPNPDSITYKELETHLATVGAKMLVDAVRNRLYIPPYRTIQLDDQTSKVELIHAPKISKEFHTVDFQTMTVTDILRRQRAVTRSHFYARSVHQPDETRHVMLSPDVRPVNDADIPDDVQAAANSIAVGTPYAIIPLDESIGEASRPLIVNAKTNNTNEGRKLVIPEILVPSMRYGPAARMAARANLFSEPEIVGHFKLYRFAHPVSLSSSRVYKAYLK